jgi:hypothetical protein
VRCADDLVALALDCEEFSAAELLPHVRAWLELEARTSDPLLAARRPGKRPGEITGLFYWTKKLPD